MFFVTYLIIQLLASDHPTMHIHLWSNLNNYYYNIHYQMLLQLLLYRNIALLRLSVSKKLFPCLTLVCVFKTRLLWTPFRVGLVYRHISVTLRCIIIRSYCIHSLFLKTFNCIKQPCSGRIRSVSLSMSLVQVALALYRFQCH